MRGVCSNPGDRRRASASTYSKTKACWCRKGWKAVERLCKLLRVSKRQPAGLFIKEERRGSAPQRTIIGQTDVERVGTVRERAGKKNVMGSLNQGQLRRRAQQQQRLSF